MATETTDPVLPPFLRFIREHRGLIVPLGFVSMLVVILVPMPPIVMDLLISANISLAVIILLTTIYMDHPLDFSVFPSLLLATTLFRLVLNVASTRLILSADANSPEQAIGVAGKVISAFGDFVAGDSLYVGIIIFAILVIVQFMVITKGAGRISEVAARFTLDAMPGKQMAIDSDLNAGTIDDEEVKRRRQEVADEADFFGAMDGASKFVRGDAVASIIITVVNILGGFAVGTIDRGWDAGKTGEVFTKLTIGDGLTSQIPSLIIAISAALIVTRSGARDQLGNELTGQLASQPRGLFITAAFLAGLALTPLPTLPLFASAGIVGGVAFVMSRRRDEEPEERPETAIRAPEPPPVESLLKVDTMELEVGYALVALVDAGQGGDLLDRISATRRQLAAELGFVMPPVRIRDNMHVSSETYRIKVRGNVIAQGDVRPGKHLAMNWGLADAELQGEKTTEPAFGLDAWWIDPEQRTRAETMNFTVVDPTSVIATHLTEVVKRHADELLTREEVNNLIEGLKERAPRLVEEAVPGAIKPGDLQKVLQNLLRERVPIRDLETILETLTEWAPRTSDLDVLTEYVRNALRRTISQMHAAPDDQGIQRLTCVTLDPTLEEQIQAYIDRSGGATALTMPARVANAMAKRIIEALERTAESPVVVASPNVRAVVWQILHPHLPNAAVLGYNEIVNEVEVESVALVAPLENMQAA
ncbi:MAG: flagellar biosynthesis protein FlhA [Phycisphaerales bacterium]|nr:flagellar biosynthesis protein FlhA [Phycisphaerales bacterium]